METSVSSYEVLIVEACALVVLVLGFWFLVPGIRNREPAQAQIGLIFLLLGLGLSAIPIYPFAIALGFLRALAGLIGQFF